MSVMDLRRDQLRAFLKNGRQVDYVSAADAEEAAAIAAAIVKPGVEFAYDADKKRLSFVFEDDDEAQAEVAVLLGNDVLALDKKTGNYLVRDKHVVSSVLKWDDTTAVTHGARIDACRSFTPVSFDPEPKPEPPPVPTQDADDSDADADESDDTVSVEGLKEFMADVRAQLASLVVATSGLKPAPAPTVFAVGELVWVRRSPTAEYEGVISGRDLEYGVYFVVMKDMSTNVAHTHLRRRDK